ncbi:MAG: LCP family protein [Candidatus Limnocylindrales bacterium]
MQQPPQEARPRHRSAFAAAFLSLIFPGLGHAYAGAINRALGFAAIPILTLALLGGIALSSGTAVFAGELAANLPLLLIANLLFLVYRVVASVDAYRVAAYLNAVEASGGGRFGRPSLRLQPLSVAGLLAVCLVIAGGHAVVAYYGTQFQSTFDCVFDPAGTNECDAPSDAPGPSDAGSLEPADSATAPATSAPPLGTPLPTAALPQWNGNDRLNILLIGADQRPKEATFNADTLIVVSIDPKTKQVAMFSLPRDTVDVPIPAGPARSVFGSAYRGKINSLWLNARYRADAFPGTDKSRGFNALKSVLGELYGLDIQYYVMVNFAGFKNIVDTLGGVTINVQNPVLDDHYPGDRGASLRVYIPAGVQHMNGTQALIYARSRHTSSDFDRAQRQQRVILSIREQADPRKVLENLTQLLTDLKTSFKTDIPQGKLGDLIGLSSQIDSTSIRSFVFAPPRFASNATDERGSIVVPNVSAIRQAVATAFKKVDPVIQRQREAVAGEDGFIWVVNGSGKVGQASSIAAYLEYLGLTASAPTKRPDTTVQQTRIRVYNGRESDLQATIALLENVFNVKATYLTDPSVTVDIIVTTGTKTANLTAPPAP